MKYRIHKSYTLKTDHQPDPSNQNVDSENLRILRAKPMDSSEFSIVSSPFWGPIYASDSPLMAITICCCLLLLLGSYGYMRILLGYYDIMVLWHLFHSVSQSKIDTRQMHPSDHWKQCHFRWLLWRLLVFRYPITAIRGPLRLDHVRHVSIPLSMEGFIKKTCRKPEFLPLNIRNLLIQTWACK